MAAGDEDDGVLLFSLMASQIAWVISLECVISGCVHLNLEQMRLSTCCMEGNEKSGTCVRAHSRPLTRVSGGIHTKTQVGTPETTESNRQYMMAWRAQCRYRWNIATVSGYHMKAGDKIRWK